MKTKLLLLATALTGFAFVAAFVPHSLAGGDGPKTKPADPAGDGPDGGKLWAQNCSRCHNSRPATSFSDAQWDVITRHMRVRAYLTGTEARAIADFLKDGN